VVASRGSSKSKGPGVGEILVGLWEAQEASGTEVSREVWEVGR
jgi:hypothetical protein